MVSNTEVSKEYEKLRRDVVQLRDDLGEVTQALLAVGSAKVSSARQRASEATEAGAETVRELLERLKQHGENAGEKVETQVREHPVMALAASFGLGFLLAKLAGRD